MPAAAALVALVAYLVLNRFMLGDVIAQMHDRAFYKTLFYLAWIAAAFALFAAVVLTARTAWLAVLLVVSCISVVINDVFAVVSRQQLTPDLMEWMVHETGQLKMAGTEFMPEIARAVLVTVALLSVFVVLRVLLRRTSLRDVLPRRAPAIALAGFLAFHGAAMLIQPSYTVAETNVLVFGLPALVTSPPHIAAVPVKPARAPAAEKVVFVVDESIAQRVFERVIAPKLASMPVIDFGEAASTAACSAPSNALLRWGLERAHIGEAGYDPRTNPTIWGFAKAAGFHTTLIEGQSKGATQNFVGKGELALIDEFVAADTGPETDARIAGMLRERLARPGRDFVFVVKRGAHFPYEMNYPSGILPMDAPKPAKYDAAVGYSTGRFFPALAEADFSKTLLVYTSDHGQNLPARAVHCSDERHPDEYAVPLVVLTQVPALKQRLAPALATMRGHASHLNIFPTLLEAFGYAPDWVETTYGATLAGPPSEYVTLGWHLPYPTRRKSTVDFWRTGHFPGRGPRNGS